MDSRRDSTSKKVFSGYFSELGEKANSALMKVEENRLGEERAADKPPGARQPTRTLRGITRLENDGFLPSFFVLLASATNPMHS